MAINYHHQTPGDLYYEACSWDTGRLPEYYPKIGTVTQLGATATRDIILRHHERILGQPLDKAPSKDEVSRRAEHVMRYAVSYTAQQERALVLGGPDAEVAKDHEAAARRLLRMDVDPLMSLMAPGTGSKAQLRIALDIIGGQSSLVPSDRVDYFATQARTRTLVSHYVEGAIDPASREGYSWATAEAMSPDSTAPVHASIGGNSPLTFIIAEAEFIRRGSPTVPLAIQKARFDRLATLVEGLPNNTWLFSIPPVTLDVISTVAQALDGHRRLRRYVRQTIQKRA